MSRRNPPSRRNKKHSREKRRRPLSLTEGQACADTPRPTIPPSRLVSLNQLPRPERSGRYAITTIYEYPPAHPQAQVPRTLEGSPGVYAVTYVLSLPGKDMFRSDFSFGELKESGDSLLLMPKDVVRVDIQVVEGPPGVPLPVHIIGHGNARGALAKLEMRIDAPTFRTAQSYAHNWIASLLSWWSFRDDVEIEVAGVYVLEESTGVSRWVGGVLGRNRAFTPQLGHVFKTDHRSLFASYREGLIATNPFYKALCFYRIIEGIKKARGAHAEALLKSGHEYREPEEIIPSDTSTFDPLEREYFQPYSGWKFSRVRDAMRALLRNAVAHLDPSGNSLVADEYDDVETCEQAIPVLRYVARQMLRHEINADPAYMGNPVP